MTDTTSAGVLEGVRFAPVTAELLALDGITINHVRVWCYVWEQTLGRPDWDLSYRQIADATGMGRATAVRSVTWLVGRGWMRRTLKRAAAGDRAPSLLTPILPKGRLKGEPTLGATGEPTRRLKGEPYQESHNQENSCSPQADESDFADGESFDEFWTLYPRKVGRLDALRAFAKAEKSVDANRIIDGVRRYAADPNLPYLAYIPHAKTWLARGAWEDGPCPARTGRKSRAGIGSAYAGSSLPGSLTIDEWKSIGAKNPVSRPGIRTEAMW